MALSFISSGASRRIEVVGLLQLEGRLAALEIVPLLDLLLGLVDGVLHLHHVHARGHVEGFGLGHGAPPFPAAV